MNTPELSGQPTTDEERVELVRELSLWFRHVQDVTPPLHRARRDAVHELFNGGMSRQEIATQTGNTVQRIRDILKERHSVGT